MVYRRVCFGTLAGNDQKNSSPGVVLVAVVVDVVRLVAGTSVYPEPVEEQRSSFIIFFVTQNVSITVPFPVSSVPPPPPLSHSSSVSATSLALSSLLPII